MGTEHISHTEESVGWDVFPAGVNISVSEYKTVIIVTFASWVLNDSFKCSASNMQVNLFQQFVSRRTFWVFFFLNSCLVQFHRQSEVERMFSHCLPSSVYRLKAVVGGILAECLPRHKGACVQQHFMGGHEGRKHKNVHMHAHTENIHILNVRPRASLHTITIVA